MALTTVARTKTWLKISGTAEDAWLTQALGAAEAAFLRLIDRKIEADDYVDWYSSNNNPVLRLRQYPVISVSEVRLDFRGGYGKVAGTFGSDTVLVEGTDYSLEIDDDGEGSEFGRLLKIGGVWPGRWVYRQGLLSPMMRPLPGSVKVSYRAGWATVPADVELAIWQTVALLKASRITGLIPGSEGFEDYRYANMVEDAAAALNRPGSLQSIVARYRRRTPRYEVFN